MPIPMRQSARIGTYLLRQKLAHRDKQFQDTLRLYAGAREMGASASTGTNRCSSP